MLRSRNQCRAATLVQVLVSIGTLFILVLILLLVMSKVRERAKWIKCQSNLHEIGIALRHYADENNGWMFPVDRGNNQPREQRWPVFVFKAAVWNPPILVCPSDNDPAEEHSYLLNSHLWEKKIRISERSLGGLTPSEVVVMGEKKTPALDYYVDGSKSFGSIVELQRHGPQLGSNYLFMDGHVDTHVSGAQILGISDPWDIPIRANSS